MLKRFISLSCLSLFHLAMPLILFAEDVKDDDASKQQQQQPKAELADKAKDSKEDLDIEATKQPKAELSDKAKDSKEESLKPPQDVDASKTEKPPQIGNFALPTSQQPAALFGFGGNVIDKGEVQLYFFADEFVGHQRFISDLIPSVLFGITDTWSIQFNFPFTPLMQDGCEKSSGLEDFFIQLEYAFYNKTTACYADQATIVANVTAPTGSVRKTPPTGFGSPSLFLGGTYYHMRVDWFVFTAQGAILTTADHRTKIGEQFLYQFGIGRNIPSPKGWIYAAMLEVDGQYNRKNRIRGYIDKNSGGNIIFVTPSLWISSKEFLLQFGVSIPVAQNLFGNQRKLDYALNLNCAWSFY